MYKQILALFSCCFLFDKKPDMINIIISGITGLPFYPVTISIFN